MAGLREWAALYLKGVAMGSADAVPGVSGGTIALIVGIYERLIAAVTAVDPARIRRLLAGARPANIPDARAAFHEIDGAFLFVLPAGIGTAVVAVLSGVVDYLLETRPVATYGFFFGLIAASAAVLFGGVSLDTSRRKAAAIAGSRSPSSRRGYASTALSSSLLVVFVAGAVAVSAMILPGVSGSLLLVVLGQYEYMSGTVSRFVDGLAAVALGNGTDALAETLPGRDVPARWGRRRVHDRPRREVRARPCPRRDARVPRQSDRRRASGAIVEVSIRLAESGETWSAAAPRFALAAVGGAALVLMLTDTPQGSSTRPGSAAFEALAVGPRKRHRPIVGSDGRGSQVIIAITIIAVMTSRDRRERTRYDRVSVDASDRSEDSNPRSPNRRDDADATTTLLASGVAGVAGLAGCVGAGRRRRTARRRRRIGRD